MVGQSILEIKGESKVHMMNKKVFSWKTVLVLISLLAALALAASAKDSKRLAQENPAPSPYAKENTAEIESHLTKAKNYFEKAEFSYAEMFYDMALRLDKDNAAIKARIEDTRQYLSLIHISEPTRPY